MTTVQEFSPRSFNRTTVDWSALVLRAIVGVGFMAHGYAKVSRGPDAFAGILQALDVSAPRGEYRCRAQHTQHRVLPRPLANGS